MTDLKACLEASKLENVATYIQSGNVFFKLPKLTRQNWSENVAQYYPKHLVRTKHGLFCVPMQKLRQIVRKAPNDFGSQPDKYRYDVIYLRELLTASEANVSIKPGVDAALIGPDVLYFSRLIAQSKPKPFDAHYCFAGLPRHDYSELEYH